jgi:DNA-binding transcriptional ArsR family regulator
LAISNSQRLDVTFAALADPTRRAILARLASGEASMTELVKPFAMSQPAISKHLKALERAGLMMKNIGTLKVTTPTDPEIVLTRVFDAPRRLVFEAFTKPELLKRWFGPRGWSELLTSATCLMESGATEA